MQGEMGLQGWLFSSHDHRDQKEQLPAPFYKFTQLAMNKWGACTSGEQNDNKLYTPSTDGTF
jgi:hypothetical protein